MPGGKIDQGVLTVTRKPDHCPRDPVLRGLIIPSGSFQ